jgi:hypothetical protein
LEDNKKEIRQNEEERHTEKTEKERKEETKCEFSDFRRRAVAAFAPLGSCER